MRSNGASSFEEAISSAAQRAAGRSFLYDDPASFRAGVEECVQAVLAALDRQGLARAETA